MHKVAPTLSLEYRYDKKGKRLQCIRLCFKFDKDQHISVPSTRQSYVLLKKSDPRDDTIYEKSVEYSVDDVVHNVPLLSKLEFILPYRCGYLMEFHGTLLLECVASSGYSFDVDGVQTQAESLIKKINLQSIDDINKNISTRNVSKNISKTLIRLEDLSDGILKIVKQICKLSEEKHKQDFCNPLEDAKIEAIASNLIKS